MEELNQPYYKKTVKRVVKKKIVKKRVAQEIVLQEQRPPQEQPVKKIIKKVKKVKKVVSQEQPVKKIVKKVTSLRENDIEKEINNSINLETEDLLQLSFSRPLDTTQQKKFAGLVTTPCGFCGSMRKGKMLHNMEGNLYFCDFNCGILYYKNIAKFKPDEKSYRKYYIARQLGEEAFKIYEACMKIPFELIPCKDSFYKMVGDHKQNQKKKIQIGPGMSKEDYKQIRIENSKFIKKATYSHLRVKKDDSK